MPKRVISSLKLPKSNFPLSPATLGGKTLYRSGLVSRNERMEIVGKGDMRGQTQQVLERVKSLVEAAGGTPQDVTQATMYFTDLAKFGGMNEIYQTYFPVDPPARATVRVDLVNPRFSRGESEHGRPSGEKTRHGDSIGHMGDRWCW